MVRKEDIIDEITQWIDSNLHNPLKIEDVAARAGYSRWNLHADFCAGEIIYLLLLSMIIIEMCRYTTSGLYR